MSVTTRKLSTPNRMVWEYYESLRRQARRASRSDRHALHQEVALTVILAVTVIEVFLNCYFRVVVSQPQFAAHRQKFLDDVAARVSLDRKINRWPREILGSPFDAKSAALTAFRELKSLRNSLVHFVSTHESVELAGQIAIEGLADTTAYDALASDDALRCLSTVKLFAHELFALCGMTPDEIPHAFHAWFGEVPRAGEPANATGSVGAQ